MSTFIGPGYGTDNLALATGYGILDQEFRRELGMKVIKYPFLSIMRELEGRMAPTEKTSEHTYYFYEEGDWFNAAVTISAATVSSSDIIITLSTEDHFDSGAKSFPVLNQLCVFEDETIGFVIAVTRTVANAHTVTIRNENASQNVITAAVLGTKVVFYSNAQKEESSTPETRVPYISKVTNNIQEFREAYKVTDWAEQNETEFEFKGQRFLYVKGLDELADRFAMQEELNMLITPTAASLPDSIKTTNGVIPQIGSNGQTVEYFDEPDLAFFGDVSLTIDDNYGDDEYFCGQGKNFSIATTNWLADFSAGGDNRISFNAFDGGKEQALSFDFKSIHIGGTTMHFQTWRVLSHKGSLGAGDMAYRHMCIMVPTGMGRDKVGNSVPYLRLRYSEPPGAPWEKQGDIRVFEHGGTSRRGATSGTLSRTVEMVSYKGLEMLNREKWLIARKGNI